MAPIWELQEKLQQDIAANPMLEMEPPPGEVSVDSDAFLRDAEPDESVTGDDAGNDNAGCSADVSGPANDTPILAADGAGDSLDGGLDREKHDFLINSLTGTVNFHEQLVSEIAVLPLSDRERRLAESVIDSLDARGYLTTAPADLAMGADAELPEIEQAIRLVQSLDPPGIGARNLGECLSIQLKRAGITDPRVHELVLHRLEDVARNRLPMLARDLNMSMEELESALHSIRSLNPYPAGGETDAAPEIVPELEIVEDEDGAFAVREDNSAIPRPRLSERYLEMLENASLDPAGRTYLLARLAEARELLASLELRGKTLRRIAEVVARTQGPFFREGPAALRPLTMREVAAELGVNETTVSRAIAGKYIRTPRGLAEFRSFFSTGYVGADGEAVSNKAVMERLRRLIAEEDPHRPLSDEALAQLLKQQNLSIARRTVAKYREMLGIPATNLRRKF